MELYKIVNICLIKNIKTKYKRLFKSKTNINAFMMNLIIFSFYSDASSR